LEGDLNHRRSAAVDGNTLHRQHQDQRATIVRAVEQSLDAIEPMIARLIDDPSVSAEHARHIVVMDPTADPATAGFDEAILVQRSFGDPAHWQADYAWYARAKTRVCWRERLTLRTLLVQCPDRLHPDDIRVEGAVRDGRWIVGASGAHPWYDHAVASTAICLFHAAIEHTCRVAASEDSGA
jgi:hypothetical protein